jgi:hypothetical protein
MAKGAPDQLLGSERAGGDGVEAVVGEDELGECELGEWYCVEVY